MRDVKIRRFGGVAVCGCTNYSYLSYLIYRVYILFTKMFTIFSTKSILELLYAKFVETIFYCNESTNLRSCIFIE